ncbi:MAG: hypothetical protein A2Y15_00345 [Clostridiales bacterium GWF2_36_10]|nr:MAG: hypothetical protein A2Y15_00345 [Clostridiales bacterium GWF2_36_10]HAN21761.1 hypothetical protein [Clostridiales bacterium]
MKKKFFKHLSVIIVIIIIATACIPFSAFGATSIVYETEGLEALYLGNDNTGSGQDTDATTWKDLSGEGNDITGITTDSNNYFTQNAFLLNTMQVNFPEVIKDVVNGQSFTIELVIGDYTSLGTTYNTILNNTGTEKLAWFRRNGTDVLEFKAYANAAADRPIASDALNLLKNSTIAITYKVGGKMTMYINGTQVDQKDCLNAMGIGESDSLFFGHSDPAKNFEAEFLAMRFYSVELTPAQVLANHNDDLIVVFGEEDDTSSVDDTSSEAVSDVVSEDASSAITESSATVSDAASSENSIPETNDSQTNIIIYGIIGLVAIVAIAVIIKKRNAVKE